MPGAQSFATFPLLASAGSGHTPSPRPGLGKCAGGFCVSRSFLNLGGSREPWAFLCFACDHHIGPSTSPKWVLGSRASLAGDGQTSGWKHFLWTRLTWTQTHVALAWPWPPRWQQQPRPLSTHLPPCSAAWGGRSLSPHQHSASRTPEPGPPAPPSRVGLSQGCPSPHVFSCFQRSQNGSPAASETGQGSLFGPHPCFGL